MGSSKTQYYLHTVIILYTYNFDDLLFGHFGSNDRLKEPQYLEIHLDIISLMTISFVSFHFINNNNNKYYSLVM